MINVEKKGSLQDSQ